MSPSVNNTEVFELSDIFVPGHVHMLDNCSLRATFAPFDQFLDIFLGTFTDNFHPAVPEISYAAREVKFVRLPLGVMTVKHPLDETTDQYLCPSHH
jgi:hypothetical protein